MQKVTLLNIPNFYSSYYVLGFAKEFQVNFKPDSTFEKYNNRGFVIFEIGGKTGVVDNHDPVGVDQELYSKVDLYFATNKLLNSPSYKQKKVRPLFPHYPVNIIPLYFKLFGLKLFTSLKPKDLARELYVLNSRPKYQKLGDNYRYGNYIFFSGSTWKKETWANQIRAEFIRACKANPKVNFEGGFIPRSDGNNFGFDEELNRVKYTPKKFSELSAKSLVSLNNPAVLGAVSWRLAEYWNFSSFVLSFPFAIDLPVVPEADKEICYVDSSSQYDKILDRVLEDPEYHCQISKGGKQFFDKYCTPEAQANYIISSLIED